MAKILDTAFEFTQTELELIPEVSEHYNENADFVNIHMILKFGEEFPEFSFTRPCALVSDVKDLIAELRELADKEKYEMYYSPLEPDFELEINHSGESENIKTDNYYLKCLVDVSGFRSLRYYGVGFTIKMKVNRLGILEFANQLEKEIEVVVEESEKGLTEKK